MKFIVQLVQILQQNLNARVLQVISVWLGIVDSHKIVRINIAYLQMMEETWYTLILLLIMLLIHQQQTIEVYAKVSNYIHMIRYWMVIEFSCRIFVIYPPLFETNFRNNISINFWNFAAVGTWKKSNQASLPD